MCFSTAFWLACFCCVIEELLWCRVPWLKLMTCHTLTALLLTRHFGAMWSIFQGACIAWQSLTVTTEKGIRVPARSIPKDPSCNICQCPVHLGYLRTLGFRFRLSSLERDYQFRSWLEQNQCSIRFPVCLSSPGIRSCVSLLCCWWPAAGYAVWLGSFLGIVFPY